MFSINNKESQESIFGSSSKLMYVVAFLVPMFFIPASFDVYSLNKTYLIVLSAFALLIMFLFQGWTRGVVFYKSLRGYIPAVALLLGAIGSTYFSTNRIISIWGQSDVYHNTLLFYAALAIIFMVFVNTRINFHKVGLMVAFGSTVSVTAAWLFLYRTITIYGSRFLAGSSFSDSWFALVALSSLSSFIFAYRLFNKNLSYGTFKFSALILGLIINLSFLVTTREYMALALVVVAVAVSAYYSKINLKANSMVLGLVCLCVLVLGGVHFVPGFTGKVGFTFPEPVRINVYHSWYVANNALLEKPFMGFGLGSFSTAYTLFKPLSVNASNYWTASFSQPFNDLFLWLTVGGLFGLLMYGIYVGVPMIKAVKYLNKDGSHLFAALTLMLSFALLMIYGSNITLSLLFTLAAAYLYQVSDYGSFAFRSKNFVLVSLIAVFGILGFSLLNMFSVYRANVLFRSSLFAANPLDGYTRQVAAVASYPYENAFIRTAAFNGISIASAISKRTDLNDEQKKLLENLIIQSAKYSAVATEVTGRRLSSNWEVRGIVYKSLINVDKEKYLNPTIQSYVNAINLDKYNPRLKTDLGILYYNLKDYQKAVSVLSEAIRNKQDYPNAYYVMSKVLKDAGNYPASYLYMDAVKKLIKESDSNYATIVKEHEELRKLAEEATKKAQEAKAAQEAKLKAPEVKLTEPTQKQNLESSDGSAVEVKKDSVNSTLDSVSKEVPVIENRNSDTNNEGISQ